MKKRLFILSMLFVSFALVTSCSDEDEAVLGGEIINEEIEDVVPGPQVVDLGLSVKWASCNVGATKPEEYGDYFAWGEIETQELYDWTTYKWSNGSHNTLTKYCTDSFYGTVDNKSILDINDDAARANMDGNWRMPTEVEYVELRYSCKWEWTSSNGVNGYRVIGPNGNSIFLPAAGYFEGRSLYDENKFGYYWSSSLYATYSYMSRCLFLGSDDLEWSNPFSRYSGRSVRAVCE